MITVTKIRINSRFRIHCRHRQYQPNIPPQREKPDTASLGRTVVVVVQRVGVAPLSDASRVQLTLVFGKPRGGASAFDARDNVVCAATMHE
jgi:hypothetical protein